MFPSLWVVFSAMMLLKGFSYALNNPTKEMLYQPTSLDVKYKSKSWIDIFGARGSKALGSVVTNAFSDNAHELASKGGVAGMLVATGLIFNAKYIGDKYDEYMGTGYLVGGDNSDLMGSYSGVDGLRVEGDVEMAEDATTSCVEEDEEEGTEGEDEEEEEEEEEETDNNNNVENEQVGKEEGKSNKGEADRK